MPLLEVDNLHIAVHVTDGLREVVRGVSFRVDRGDALGMVGESGSGKTLSTSAIVRLLPAAARITDGQVRLNGVDLTHASARVLSAVRGKEISLVVQDSLASLNPIMRVGKQVSEPLLLHHLVNRKGAMFGAMEMLRSLGLPDPARLTRGYPHEFSGGMRQRAMIATALIASPPLIIADEPTTALDATVQAQILGILGRLNREKGVALILVSHDLGVVSEICDHIAVMYAGRIVETGSARAILEQPLHPYTQALVESVPTSALPRFSRLKAIPGEPPGIEALPSGCPFRTRCPHATDICREKEPELKPRHAGEVACWHAEEIARGVSSGVAGLQTITAAPGEAAAPPAIEPPAEELLRVESITRHYRMPSAWPFLRPVHIHALDEISLTVRQGETLGIAGETGCGKSTLANCLLRLTDVDSGRILFRRQDITTTRGDALRRLRRHIQPIFQDPYGSLNPRQRVRSLVAEALTSHGVPAAECEDRVTEVLQFVGLGAHFADKFPHELSGGQRQRVGIGRAIAINPQLIIADEPVSALDVSVQAQVINLFMDLQRRFALTLIFISHDLRVVRHLSSHVAIMFLGKVVEYGPAEVVCTNPLHPYTQALLSSVPGIGHDPSKGRLILRGDPPSPISPPSGCRFRTRCPYAAAICAEVVPELQQHANERMVACHFAGIASQSPGSGEGPRERQQAVVAGRQILTAGGRMHMNCRTATAELIVDAHSWIGEGPVWDGRGGRLIWVDVAAGLIHAFDPGSKAVTTHNAGQPVGSVALSAAGGLIAAMRDGIGLLQDEGGEPTRLIEIEKDVTGSRMNDGKCDCRGRFWAGTMAVDHTPGAGTLYRVEQADGKIEVSARVRGSTISNGLDWSDDNRRMYYIDSATQRIDVFDFDAEAGLITNRRPFVVVPRQDGLPDGMTIDAEGYVWVALFGGGRVRRYSPEGEVDMEVQVPVTLVTSCTFGGRDLRDLYITTARHRLTATEATSQPTAGALFASRPGPQGRPAFLFGR